MPDWLSHIFVALIIGEAFNIRFKSLLVLGSLLPDFFTKVYLLNYFANLPAWLTFDPFIFHKVIPAIIAACLLAYLFRSNFLYAFLSIPIGASLHILLDATTKHYYITQWFRVLWSDQYWVVTIISGIIYLIVKLIKRGDKHETKKGIGRESSICPQPC